MFTSSLSKLVSLTTGLSLAAARGARATRAGSSMPLRYFMMHREGKGDGDEGGGNATDY